MRAENQGSGVPAGAMESLYPFLYSGTTDLPAVLEQVRASTVAKVKEIVELRRVIAARDGARLASCARQVAASGAVDHLLVAASSDPRVVKELHVTLYHVLWELVHVFFEQPGVLGPGVVT